MDSKCTIREVNGKKYKVTSDGTWYNENTDDRLIHLMETARLMRYPVRLFYGDHETGRDWMEESDMHGFIGRSNGTVRIPIILKSSRSMGGPGILDHCIVRFQWKQGQLKHDWRIEKYQKPDLVVSRHPGLNKYVVHPLFDSLESYVAAFSKADSAKRYLDFVEGRRMNR